MVEPLVRKPKFGEVGGFPQIAEAPPTYNTPQPQFGDAGLSGAIHSMVDHPLFSVAQVVPGLNIPANALAYGSHMARDMTGDAVVDSLSMIPGAGFVGKGGLKAAANALSYNPLRHGTRFAVQNVARKAGTLMQGEQLGEAGMGAAKASGVR